MSFAARLTRWRTPGFRVRPTRFRPIDLAVLAAAAFLLLQGPLSVVEAGWVTNLEPLPRLALAGLLSIVAFDAPLARAQGCAPSRFTTPSLGALGGGDGDIYLGKGTWQLGLGYRDVNSNQLIVGHGPRNDLAPGGNPSIVHTQSLSFSLIYGVTDRLSVSINAPMSWGRLENTYPDGQRHAAGELDVHEL